MEEFELVLVLGVGGTEMKSSEEVELSSHLKKKNSSLYRTMYLVLP